MGVLVEDCGQKMMKFVIFLWEDLIFIVNCLWGLEKIESWVFIGWDGYQDIDDIDPFCSFGGKILFLWFFLEKD